jgi:diguanylate cyclase (GGDEF)-like protein/PAS domain S-box-containing protein
MADSKADALETILVIEYNEVERGALATRFQTHGFHTLGAADSRRGLETFRRANPDVVLLALSGDDVADFEVLSVITKEAPEIPVLVLGPEAPPIRAAKLYRLGAWDYICRPVDTQRLTLAAENALNRAKRLREARDHQLYLERRAAELELRSEALASLSDRLRQEIQERERTERRLRQVQAAIDDATDAILITDHSGEAVYANISFGYALGYTVDTLNAVGLPSIFTEEQTAEDVRLALENTGTYNAEVHMVSREGRGFVALLHASSISDGGEGSIGRLYIFADISEQKKLEEQLREQAFHDALTGLYNRRHFQDLMDLNTSLARRHSHALSVCLCDLDHFKQVNDTWGHRSGDEVLVKFCEVVRSELRAEDIAARYGGDEFCILFPSVVARDAAVCLERIRQRFGALVFRANGGETFSVTATFGITDFEPTSVSDEELIEMADQCLYEAKAHGRNCVVANMQVMP